MSYQIYAAQQNQFQGLDYVFSEESHELIMLPHGSEAGKLYNRAGQEVSEEKLMEVARIIRGAFARKYSISESDIAISAAPCYPNAARNNTNSLEILGDWDTPTWADFDGADFAFIIKSHDCSVRPGWNNC